MELKSRQMLRSHKQDTHGVMPISTPARSKQSFSVDKFKDLGNNLPGDRDFGNLRFSEVLYWITTHPKKLFNLN